MPDAYYVPNCGSGEMVFEMVGYRMVPIWNSTVRIVDVAKKSIIEVEEQ